jgi:hypothetical protein
MARTVAPLALSSSLMLAVFLAGCGSSSPAANGKAGNDGGSDTATGAAGATAGITGTTGAGGDNGSGGAAAGAGGASAGAGGSSAGTAGGAGGGTAGTGTGAAGTSGLAGNGGAGGGSAGTGAGGAKADGGTDAAATPCTVGSMCADGFTCTNVRACGPNREQFCFCDPNGKVACEGCSAVDGGTGTDAGATLKACPANVTNRNATCTMNEERCAETACTNGHQDECICAVFSGATGRWFCATVTCQ